MWHFVPFFIRLCKIILLLFWRRFCLLRNRCAKLNAHEKSRITVTEIERYRITNGTKEILLLFITEDDKFLQVSWTVHDCDVCHFIVGNALLFVHTCRTSFVIMSFVHEKDNLSIGHNWSMKQSHSLPDKRGRFKWCWKITASYLLSGTWVGSAFFAQAHIIFGPPLLHTAPHCLEKSEFRMKIFT